MRACPIRASNELFRCGGLDSGSMDMLIRVEGARDAASAEVIIQAAQLAAARVSAGPLQAVR